MDYRKQTRFKQILLATFGGTDACHIPYCYYYKRVLILVNIGDLVITVPAIEKLCRQ